MTHFATINMNCNRERVQRWDSKVMIRTFALYWATMLIMTCDRPAILKLHICVAQQVNRDYLTRLLGKSFVPWRAYAFEIHCRRSAKVSPCVKAKIKRQGKRRVATCSFVDTSTTRLVCLQGRRGTRAARDL